MKPVWQDSCSTFYQDVASGQLPGLCPPETKTVTLLPGPAQWCWPDSRPPIRNQMSRRNGDICPGSHLRLPFRLEQAACKRIQQLCGVKSRFGPKSRHPLSPGQARAQCQGGQPSEQGRHAEVLCGQGLKNLNSSEEPGPEFTLQNYHWHPVSSSSLAPQKESTFSLSLPLRLTIHRIPSMQTGFT